MSARLAEVRETFFKILIVLYLFSKHISARRVPSDRTNKRRLLSWHLNLTRETAFLPTSVEQPPRLIHSSERVKMQRRSSFMHERGARNKALGADAVGVMENTVFSILLARFVQASD